MSTGTAPPEAGSVWWGCGRTVLVVEVFEGDVRVDTLVAGGYVKQRPSIGIIPLREFVKYMKPFHWVRSDDWAQAIKDVGLQRGAVRP